MFVNMFPVVCWLFGSLRQSQTDAYDGCRAHYKTIRQLRTLPIHFRIFTEIPIMVMITRNTSAIIA